LVNLFLSVFVDSRRSLINITDLPPFWITDSVSIHAYLLKNSYLQKRDGTKTKQIKYIIYGRDEVIYAVWGYLPETTPIF